MYGMRETNYTFPHREQYAATLVIGFHEGLRENAEIERFDFEHNVFDLDIDEAEYIEKPNDYMNGWAEQ